MWDGNREAEQILQMMQFEYFRPAEAVRPLIGSYYSITVPEALSDVMRAEIANARFILAGAVSSDMGGEMRRFVPGDAILCGPTFKWSRIEFEAGTVIVGAAITPLGWLERMTQYKDKASHQQSVVVGLLDYPVLMAADILAYKATHVPVGEDQRQHLELSRDIADRFNREFGAPGFFPLPEALTEGPGARIMSLKDGTKKMSKSDPAENSRINLIDDADTISRKIKKSKTDTLGDMPSDIAGLEGRPEVANLVGIYGALANMSDEQVLAEYGGKGFGTFKPALAELAVEHLAPITERMRELMDNPDEIDAALRSGAERANALAEPIMEEVRQIVGFWRP